MVSIRMDGCLPLTEKEREIQANLVADAVTFYPEFSWTKRGEMPVIKWDANLEAWLDDRVRLLDRYREDGYNLFPWEIFQSLPAQRRRGNVLNWFQGSVPDCMFHGGIHAVQDTTLVEMALGSPLYYESFLPILPYWLSKGRSLAGGQSVVAYAEWVNKEGLFPSRYVGEENQRIPSGWEQYQERTKNWQVGICFIEDELPDKILKAARAGLYVTFGASVIYRSSEIDKNGVKIMAAPGGGAHAQELGSYMAVGGEEYVFLKNSHGEIYKESPNGEPKVGAWLNRAQLESFCRSMPTYGHPVLHFVEGETAKSQFVNEINLVKSKPFQKALLLTP